MTSKWLFGNHIDLWLDLNLIILGKNAGEFEDIIGYSESTIERYRSKNYADKVKTAKKEEIIWTCAKGFKKNTEIAYNSLLLNLDYLNDIFDSPNKSLVEKHLFKHKIDSDKFCKDHPEIKVALEFSQKFLKLNRLKCNLLYEFFDVYFYEIDFIDFSILKHFTIFNAIGRELLKKALSTALSQNSTNHYEIPYFKLNTFNGIKECLKNKRALRALFKKSDLTFRNNLKSEISIEKHWDEYQNRIFSKEFLLGKMLLKFITFEKEIPYVSLSEFKSFSDKLEQYASMNSQDWDFLMALNKISIEDRDDIYNYACDLTLQDQYLRNFLKKEKHTR